MKYIIAFYISSHYINPTLIQCRVPLNPILGETYQREMPTGEKFYAEQISHHPPITYFSLEGPNQEYQFYGYYQLKAWINGPNQIGGSKKGKIEIKFKDGGHYELNDPMLLVKGLVTGNKVSGYLEHMQVFDKVNEIIGNLHYNPWSDNTYSGMLKRTFWKKSKSKDNEKPKRDDDIHITVYKSKGLQVKKIKKLELQF